MQRGQTGAQCHDERHRNGPCSDAAGIEGHRQELLGHQKGHHKDHSVQADEQLIEGPAELGPQRGYRQEPPHSHRHGEDDDQIRNSGNLAGQHRQVRLGNGDKHADDKAQWNDPPEPFPLGDLAADPIPDGHHGQIHAQREEPHAYNE